MPVETSEPLLSARNLRKSFSRAIGLGASSSKKVVAVDGVSFDLHRGETLGIAGESGCGKTTLARMLVRLIEPDEGELTFLGQNLLAVNGRELRALRRRIQIVFQDPASSLNPRMRVGAIIGEPLDIHEPRLSKSERQSRIDESIAAVGLESHALHRFPHEFSGGQRQRINIARALVLRPDVIIGDEPVSALDVSVGAQILVLLSELQRRFGLTSIIISHSMPVLAQLADRVAVMQAGRFVEVGPTQQVFSSPQNPYTQTLLSSVPQLTV
jgi:ABC-type glutathione transport system ATPase component